MQAIIRGGSGIVIMKIIISGKEMKKRRRKSTVDVRKRKFSGMGRIELVNIK